LTDTLVRNGQQPADVPLRQTEPGQGVDRLAGLERRESLLFVRLGTQRGGVPEDLVGLGADDRLDGEVERIGRDLEQEGDRIAGHAFDLVEPARLAEDARKLDDADRPPSIRALGGRRVGRPHRSHHRVPSSFSSDRKMAGKVGKGGWHVKQSGVASLRTPGHLTSVITPALPTVTHALARRG
jgi:hypothetical protein